MTEQVETTNESQEKTTSYKKYAIYGVVALSALAAVMYLKQKFTSTTSELDLTLSTSTVPDETK